MTDQGLSLQAGKSYNYLAEVKNRNKEAYTFIKEIGITKYLDNAYRYTSQLANIYYEIKDSKNMTFTEFYNKHLVDQHASKYAFCVYLKNKAFSNIESMTQLKTYKKMENIINKYEIYKKEKEC